MASDLTILRPSPNPAPTPPGRGCLTPPLPLTKGRGRRGWKAGISRRRGWEASDALRHTIRATFAIRCTLGARVHGDGGFRCHHTSGENRPTSCDVGQGGGYGGGCWGKRPGSSSEFVRNKSGRRFS